MSTAKLSMAVVSFAKGQTAAMSTETMMHAAPIAIARAAFIAAAG